MERTPGAKTLTTVWMQQMSPSAPAFVDAEGMAQKDRADRHRGCTSQPSSWGHEKLQGMKAGRTREPWVEPVQERGGMKTQHHGESPLLAPNQGFLPAGFCWLSPSHHSHPDCSTALV